MMHYLLLLDIVRHLQREIEWEEDEARGLDGQGYYFKAASYRKTSRAMRTDIDTIITAHHAHHSS